MNAAPELLKAAAQGDEQACEQMLRENSGLIWSIVRRYYGRGVEPDDLYQLGCLGFIKAIKGFDFAFGTQFSTYAVPKIAGEIRRFLRDDGAIKVSRSMREQAATIFAAREKLKNTLGREPALSELSEETADNYLLLEYHQSVNRLIRIRQHHLPASSVVTGIYFAMYPLLCLHQLLQLHTVLLLFHTLLLLILLS